MTISVPDVGRLLVSLDRYLVRAELKAESITVEVAPTVGRKSAAFTRTRTHEEYAAEQFRDVMLDASRWLSVQPEVPTQVDVVETGRPLALASALRRLIGAVTEFCEDRLVEGGELSRAMAGSVAALEQRGYK